MPSIGARFILGNRYYPENASRNWRPEIGSLVVFLDIEESRSNSIYTGYIGQYAKVVSVRNIEDDHTFVGLRVIDNYNTFEEVYSWRVGPTSEKPSWEI